MKKNKPTMAARADRYKLYEQSVQCPDADLDFAERVFYERNGRKPYSLREDFCASAAIACNWVKRNRRNTAIGVDLDSEVLAWGSRNHIEALTPGQQQRIRLLQGDVMRTASRNIDLVMALNFSYWIFMDRTSMKEYFTRARKNLSRDGLLIMDAFGGTNACVEMKEKTTFGKFTYIWEQAQFDPVSGAMLCHIHFSFPDNSRLTKAFTYKWRLWSMPELQDLLYESGFDTDIYWEGEDESGDGNGEYELLQGKASADPAWISYIVASPR